MKNLYELDFYKWSLCQSENLKKQRYEALDFDHLAEEIESLAKKDKKSLKRQLIRLIAHLLKKQAQPHDDHKSWDRSIKDARSLIKDILDDSPSLANCVNSLIEDNYEDCVEWASSEQGINESEYPKKCPWTAEEVMGIIL